MKYKTFEDFWNSDPLMYVGMADDKDLAQIVWEAAEKNFRPIWSIREEADKTTCYPIGLGPIITIGYPLETVIELALHDDCKLEGR